MSGRLAAIHVYPIKGMRGIPMAAARLDAFGIEHDRAWMVTDPDGDFLTQRQHPSLVLVEGEIGTEQLVLHAPAMEPLHLPLERPEGDRSVAVRVWRDTLPALPCAPEADDWFSRLLGRTCRLVRLPAEPARRAGGAPIPFSDGYPLHLLSLASLAELNRRLPAPIGVERFRPNLVIDDVAPHAEDGWNALRIGKATLDVVAPCERCAVTTVNPADASRGAEPLRTLATYRRSAEGGVEFGVYAAHRAPATLRVGDRVESL